MKTVTKMLLGCGGALAIAGAAVAASHELHHMDVALPGGGVAHVSYAGNVAPRVVIEPVAPAGDWLADFAPLPMPGFAPFRMAAFDRMFADMEAQMAATNAALAQSAPGSPISRAALQSLPPGTTSYSMVTTINGNQVCSRSVSMTAAKPGMRPQLVSRTSGDCGPAVRQDDKPVMAATPPRAPVAPQAPLQRVSASY